MPEKLVPSDTLLRCRACSTYISQAEGFTCPRCRQGPFCKKHRLPGRRECSGCTFEIKHRELIDLKKQEDSIMSFIKLLQFIFLVFAVFFISLKAGLTESVDFLKDSIITENLVYVGALPAVGCAVFYLILYNQRGAIDKLEKEMSKMERTRMSR